MEDNDIKAVELRIDADEVVKRYPVTEAIEVVRCRTCIFFHSTGFFVVSRPTMANSLKGGALFETLRWYCDYMDSRDGYGEDDRQKYDTLAAMVVNTLTLPLDIFTDMDLMLDISDYVLNRRRDYYDRLTAEAAQPREDTLDDAVENANFEGEVLAQQELMKELGRAAGEGADV